MVGDVPWKVFSKKGARSGLSYIHEQTFLTFILPSKPSVLESQIHPAADMLHRRPQAYLEQLIFHAQARRPQRLGSLGCHSNESI